MFQEKLVLFPSHPPERVAALGLVEVSKGVRPLGLVPWGSLLGPAAFHGELNCYPNWDKTSFQY